MGGRSRTGGQAKTVMRSLPKKLSLRRLFTSFSVRSRIIALALMPVVGLAANGLTYLSGERDVGSAFATFQKSVSLADASRDFKSAVAAMRISVKDFSASPSPNLVINFQQA